jgi:hypothetical protein
LLLLADSIVVVVALHKQTNQPGPINNNCEALLPANEIGTTAKQAKLGGCTPEMSMFI